jgi:ADP-dependent NAD(P)H-hydrate dehydratase / NAD(P)H-hydrate epimerase
MLEGLKVVTSQEMARIEKKSISAGASAEQYMLQAAEGIAQYICHYIEIEKKERFVTALIGKGNNGGDACVAGMLLLKKGFRVKAFCVFNDEECSLLNQKYRKRFVQAGGELITITSVKDFQPYPYSLIIDGLLGTGLSGEIKGLLQQIIDAANRSSLPIISIDIPSGLDGNTGGSHGAIIQAKTTCYLGLPKLGFFIRKGYEQVGRLQLIDFGLNPLYIGEAKAFGFLLSEHDVAALLPKIQRTRHKYERGYVIALAGSKGMPGAALLTCLSTLRAGAGIVRLFHPEGMEAVLSSSFDELIKTPWSPQKDQLIFEEARRARSMLIGPGMGNTDEVEQEIIKVLSRIHIPCVLDADALEIFARSAQKYPQHVVLTPHRKEMMRCLQKDSVEDEEQFFALCQHFADQKNVTIVLKGAPTWVFHPYTPLLIIPRGDPGMATAGAGDVLAGVIAALLAQGLKTREAAALGVYLHALAGEKAAMDKTSYSVIASDLIEQLPDVFRQIQEYRKDY